ncbi:helix-turn-helix domain-containing protein [Salmonella enterica]|nr:XRE family transcriptional regulator [Salmonella enterica subsp. enterica]EEM3128561.1 helix-turn-helix domain-containing protein [Salmonella enterica]ECC9711533.1 XRE family transcriptional regulator [Salmonella enterica subsp. enterica]EDV0714695.1 helix-turn-helix domain-containing protein [Salmonella enterica subsp. enterica]EFS2827365.1 helix-turn-helix domain-containing protein [Salmonella enterica]
MTNSSIDYSQKLRQIRKAEGLTQKQFAELTGLSITTVKSYESSQQPARAKVVEAVLQVDLFEKYMFWLMKDKTLPSAGQISPALSLDGSIQSEADHVSIETDQKSPRSRRNAG